jgi:hypothetical protein
MCAQPHSTQFQKTIDTWKKRQALGWDLPFDWGDTPLKEYVDERIYDVSWGWDGESDKATHPWLIWDPPESSSIDDSPEETRLVDALKRERLFPQWEPFRNSTGFEGEFRPASTPESCVIGVLPGYKVRPSQGRVQQVLQSPGLGLGEYLSTRRSRPWSGIAYRWT